jgi:hypothetical protein
MASGKFSNISYIGQDGRDKRDKSLILNRVRVRLTYSLTLTRYIELEPIGASTRRGKYYPGGLGLGLGLGC